MKFTAKTKLLQGMINRVIRGASNNKLLPITSFVYIVYNSDTKLLSMTTTDMTNYITISEPADSDSTFEVVIGIDVFSKLISKTTTDEITMEITDSALVLNGNGKYNINLPVNEEGVPVKFPLYNFTSNGTSGTLSYTYIKSILDTNKICIAKDMSTPSLTGYFCGDNVITTDVANICINQISLFGQPLLISQSLMNLLGLFDGSESITYEVNDTKIKFTTASVIVYGSLMSDIEDYPSEPIESYLDANFESNCKVSKCLLLNVLDRMTLFTNQLEESKIVISFNSKNVIITNSDNTATETIPYLEITDKSQLVDYTCQINANTFRQQISTVSTDIVDISYAHEQGVCLKIIDESVIKITALLDEE